MLYKSLSTNEQKPAGFVGGSSKEKKQHPVWKNATLKKVETNPLCVELNAIFLAGIEEMKHGKILMFGFLLTHGRWPMAWSMVKQKDNGNLA